MKTHTLKHKRKSYFFHLFPDVTSLGKQLQPPFVLFERESLFSSDFLTLTRLCQTSLRHCCNVYTLNSLTKIVCFSLLLIPSFGVLSFQHINFHPINSIRVSLCFCFPILTSTSYAKAATQIKCASIFQNLPKYHRVNNIITKQGSSDTCELIESYIFLSDRKKKVYLDTSFQCRSQ